MENKTKENIIEEFAIEGNKIKSPICRIKEKIIIIWKNVARLNLMKLFIYRDICIILVSYL